jgi:hypothetical protein
MHSPFWRRNPTKTLGFLLPWISPWFLIGFLLSSPPYAQSFLAQKSNQNTWFSATLDFSLIFDWFSAFSPTLSTVVSKKNKLSCFGGFFSLVF